MLSTEAVLSQQLSGLENYYPELARIIKNSITKGVSLRKGVLLIGHTPEIATESYCHVIYPPINHNELENKILALGGLPDKIKLLYRYMNGVTLFWGGFEVWGFMTDDDHFTNPAFDLLEENVKSDDSHIGLASNNCGDTLVLNRLTGVLQLVSREPGLETPSFSDLDEFFYYMKEINNGN